MFIKVYQYLNFIRPINLLISLFTVMISVNLIAPQSSMETTFPIYMVVGLFLILGNIINDLYDVEIDQINQPNRLLAKGLINNYYIWIVWATILCIAIYFTLFLNHKSLYLSILILLLIILYTPFFKGFPIIGNVIISCLVGMVFIFVELALLNEIQVMNIPFFLAFGLTWIREFNKDIEDVEGDLKFNLKTFPAIYKEQFASKILTILIIIFMFFSYIPFFTHYQLYGYEYLFSISLFINIPLAVVINNINYSNQLFSQNSILLKIVNILGILIIYISLNW